MWLTEELKDYIKKKQIIHKQERKGWWKHCNGDLSQDKIIENIWVGSHQSLAGQSLTKKKCWCLVSGELERRWLSALTHSYTFALLSHSRWGQSWFDPSAPPRLPWGTLARSPPQLLKGRTELGTQWIIKTEVARKLQNDKSVEATGLWRCRVLPVHVPFWVKVSISFFKRVRGCVLQWDHQFRGDKVPCCHHWHLTICSKKDF